MSIYISDGFLTSHMQQIRPENAFSYLADYQPQLFDGRLDSFKKNQAKYVISGYIEPDENGRIIRNNDSLIRRDLFFLDYDDLAMTEDELKTIIASKLKDYNYILYPSVSNGLPGKGVRYRLVIEPDRPLVEFEYKHVLKEIVTLIGIPIDESSVNTWSQAQGLPSCRSSQADKYQLIVNRGKSYVTPRRGQVPLPPKKVYIFKADKVEGGQIDHASAIKMIKDYLEVDGKNLISFENSISAIMVMAKAVMNGEIAQETALEGCKLIAMGNTDWIEGNISTLLRTLESGNEPRTAYTFKGKFYDLFFSKIETMDDLKKRLRVSGDEWRLDHTEFNESGKARTEMMLPDTVARIIQDHCEFRLIGDSADKSPLYVFNLDKGIYDASDTLINQLIKAVEYRYNFIEWKKVKAHLRTDVLLVKPLKDRYSIAVANGVFDLLTKTLNPFSPKYYITSKISTSYNPTATMPNYFDINEWFSSLACGDDEIVTLLWQMINEAINPNYTRSKIGILVGDGNNGKGTFQKMLINLLGEENISALKPPEFGERFKIANLIGKVANIGDDISNAYIDEISNLMSIATNDTITIEEKGFPAFDVTLSLFCLFSGNDVPKVRNKSQGWYRRLLLIPFNADFNGTAEKPEIKNKYIHDKAVLEYVLKYAIEYDFKRFIEPQAVKDSLTEYKKENDYITAYVEDEYIGAGFHKFEKVPVEFIRNDITEYLIRRRINSQLKYHFMKDFIKAIETFTGDKYDSKTVRYNPDYRSTLPSHMQQFTSDIIKPIRSLVKDD